MRTEQEQEKTEKEFLEDMAERNDHTGRELVEAVLYSDIEKAKEVFARWLKRETENSI